MSLGFCEYLKWNTLSWTLSADQTPATKGNCRKADLFIYLGESNRGLTVRNSFHMQLGENSSEIWELISKYVPGRELTIEKNLQQRTATYSQSNNTKISLNLGLSFIKAFGSDKSLVKRQLSNYNVAACSNTTRTSAQLCSDNNHNLKTTQMPLNQRMMKKM